MTTKHAPPRLRARHALSLLGLSAALLGAAGAASAVPPTILYVSPTGSDSNPGTQASPFLTIQAAITAANSGDTIDIDDGTYTGVGNVDLDTNGKNLTIQSEHGAARTIIDCGGSSSADHRGFYIHSGETVSITGLIIKNGYESNSYGGGIYVVNSSMTLANCIVSGNTASYYGGGIYDQNNGGGLTLTLTNCAITGNTASYGGGIFNTGGGFNSTNVGNVTTLTNCTIAGNTASYYGGLYSQNYNGFMGGSNNSTTTLTNCIVYGDTSSNNTEIYTYTGNTSAAFTVKSSDIQGGLPLRATDGGGNIDAVPLFVSATDFHLLPGSPALGTGDGTSAPATDLDGLLRPVLPSMGAYEVGAAPVTLTAITITSAASSVSGGATDQFTATATYSDNTTADVSTQATWASDDTSKATIDSTGLATGVAVGTANITATVGSITSSATALTVSAPIILPTYSYQALWSNTNGSFSLWNVALGGGFTPHDFDASPGYTAQSVADTPDGHVHVLLSAASGAVQFDDAVSASLVRQHNASTQLSYGPFNGWTAHSIAAGPDGVLRVFWTRTDGQMSLWKLHANGTYDHAEYGPYAGWTARLMSVAHDNTVRIVWTKTDGQMSFWVMNAQGGFAHAEYGAYPGWTPTALTTSATGQNLVSWTRASDGKLSLWALADSGQFTFVNFGPFAGWTASSLTVGADSTLHVGWTQTGGAASLWDLSGAAFQSSVYGPYSAWHLQGLAAAP